MKYTYYSSIRSGKHILRDMFWLNKRSHVTLLQNKPLCCTMSKPVGKLYKIEWYWCNKQNELEYHNHFIDVSDKLLDKHYCEMWFYKKDNRGNYEIPYDLINTHTNFWGCIDEILDKDLINNPFILFGYAGKGKDNHKVIKEMQSDNPMIKPHPDIVQQLRKRKSIVAYKEDIEHLAYNIFSGTGRPESEEQTIRLVNRVRRFQEYMPRFLDKHDIPYEMFSLDRGDYAKTFNLDKVLPRDSTDNLWINDLGQDIKKQVSNYMKNYT